MCTPRGTPSPRRESAGGGPRSSAQSSGPDFAPGQSRVTELTASHRTRQDANPSVHNRQNKNPPPTFGSPCPHIGSKPHTSRQPKRTRRCGWFWPARGGGPDKCLDLAMLTHHVASRRNPCIGEDKSNPSTARERRGPRDPVPPLVAESARASRPRARERTQCAKEVRMLQEQCLRAASSRWRAWDVGGATSDRPTNMRE